MKPQLAIYLRLSVEDIDLKKNKSKDESNSVGNQRLLIRNYIARKPELTKLPILEFCDDGYTGTNFERPQFQSMMELVKDGQISCVIVKDLSRFGRSYLEVGDYLEHIFPFLGVRFIAVNDNFDSSDYIGITSGIDIAFRNLLHQKYSEDLSDKVKSAMRMKMAKGKYVNHAPFGYMKSSEDKHRIVLDPVTAPIVREIFDAILAGHSTTEIAVSLNSRQVLTPMGYKQWKTREQLTGRLPIWNHRTVLRVLRDLKYTGVMVNHKCENQHIRDKSQRRVPQSEWIITEEMHEAIVSKEEFRVANEAIRTVAKCEKKASESLDCVYYCGHCGRKLRKSCNTRQYYACDTSVYQPGAKCGDYRWEKTALEDVVLSAYKKQLLLLERRLRKQRVDKGREKPVDFTSQIRHLETALETCSSEKLNRYEQYRSGQISKDEFLEQKALLTEKINRLEDERSDLDQQLALRRQTLAEQINLKDALIEITNNAGHTDEELKAQMYEDINKIFVFSNKDIEIHWKFEDWFVADAGKLSEQKLSYAI